LAFIAIGTVFVSLCELLLGELALKSAGCSSGSSLLPDRADLVLSYEMLCNSSSGPLADPLALSMDSLAILEGGASSTILSPSLNWGSVLGVDSCWAFYQHSILRNGRHGLLSGKRISNESHDGC